MPLSAGSPALICANLEAVQNGERARPVVIGTLTDAQLTAINDERHAHGYPAIVAEVVFMGRHVFASRIERDGYNYSTKSQAAWIQPPWCFAAPRQILLNDQ